MGEETVTISKAKYKRLLDDQSVLRRLEAAGVDNWEGYSYAFDDEDEEDNS